MDVPLERYEIVFVHSSFLAPLSPTSASDFPAIPLPSIRLPQGISSLPPAKFSRSAISRRRELICACDSFSSRILFFFISKAILYDWLLILPLSGLSMRSAGLLLEFSRPSYARAREFQTKQRRQMERKSKSRQTQSSGVRFALKKGVEFFDKYDLIHNTSTPGAIDLLLTSSRP